MNVSAIRHRCAFNDCYAVNKDEIVINITTGKDITKVNIIHNDPYSAGISGRHPWIGEKAEMELTKELKTVFIWSIKLTPEFKRQQYYFEIFSDKEKVYLLEDGLYTEKEINAEGKMKQYFKYPWINTADICQCPKWVEKTIWYQIMPDKFCRGRIQEKKRKLREWNETENLSYDDFYGGDIKGIIEKLEYLKNMGISGIYLTPIFESDTNHKYNTFDYRKIDTDFGNEEDLKELIHKAHSMGIRVMLDAVFNHCGTEFFPWKDVVRNGKNSKYYDWFFISKENFFTNDIKTKDGRYFSFAFEANMPKLNTNNEEVMAYFLDICRYWVREWKIDGIRFDVGNEISHQFVKKLHYELKKINPELFLLGEIWHDSIQWLLGDEYDSVMNYPFLETINDFWVEKEKTSYDFMYGVNRCFSMYYEQTNHVLFNLLDSHDVIRAYTRCGENIDIFLQQIVIVMTMPGTPCIYYGTEIAMSGHGNPYNRKSMPWDEIEDKKYESIMNEVKAVIALRIQYPQMNGEKIEWRHSENARLIHYMRRTGESNSIIEVYLNASKEETRIPINGKLVYSRNYKNGYIQENGILVIESEEKAIC